MTTQDLMAAPAEQTRILSPGGNIIDPTAVNTLLRMAKIWHESGLLPQHVKTPQQALTIAMMGDALGINYLTALQHLYVTRGKVGTEAKLARALAIRSGQLETFKLDTSATEATCTLKRKGWPEHKEKVTMEMAKRAGWTSNEKYQTEPDVMLGERATMRALRKILPDVILGLYTHDELGIRTSAKTEWAEVLDDEPAGPPISLTTSTGNAEQVGPMTVTTFTEEVPGPKPDSVKDLDKPAGGAGDLATEEQKDRLKLILKTLYPDASPVVMPSEKRKISEAIAKEPTAARVEQEIEAWTEHVRTRLEKREAKVAAEEAAQA